MSGFQWQCISCGTQKDGVLNCKPDVCICGSTDFEPVEPTELIDDRKENEHDLDYLAGS